MKAEDCLNYLQILRSQGRVRYKDTTSPINNLLCTMKSILVCFEESEYFCCLKVVVSIDLKHHLISAASCMDHTVLCT